MLARHDDAAPHVGRQLRLAPADLGRIDLAHIGDAIGMGLGDHGGKARQLLLGPGGHQPAALQQRQIEGPADGEIFAMARLDAGLFEAAGGRVEAGMEHGAIGLAGAGQDVGRTFQQEGLEPAEGEAAEEGAADHAATDDGEVEGHEEVVRLARDSERERGNLFRWPARLRSSP